MAEVNDAYRKGDIGRIREIVGAYLHAPENVDGVGVAAELVRAIRKIRQARTRLLALGKERELLMAGPRWEFYERWVSAKAGGRDLIEDVCARARFEIRRLERA